MYELKSHIILVGILVAIGIRMMDTREIRHIAHTSSAEMLPVVTAAVCIVSVGLLQGVAAGLVMYPVIRAFRAQGYRAFQYQLASTGYVCACPLCARACAYMPV